MRVYSQASFPGTAEQPPSVCLWPPQAVDLLSLPYFPVIQLLGNIALPQQLHVTTCPRRAQPSAEPQEGSRCVCSLAEFIFLWKQLFRGTVARDNWNGEERMLRLGARCFSEVFKSAPGPSTNLAVIQSNFSVSGSQTLAQGGSVCSAILQCALALCQ